MTELMNNLKPLTDKNAQLVTKTICKKGVGGNSSILPRIKFRVGGQGISPQSPSAHSLSRCSKQKKNEMKFKPFPEIKSTRLFLRNIQESDCEEILFLRSDKSVTKYIERPESGKN